LSLLPDPIGVYAILDAGLVGAEGLPGAAEAMACAGIRVFQVRGKSLCAGSLEALVLSVRSVLPGDALLIVNDRADVALETGADGVHVGDDDLPVEEVRRVLPASAVVGRSTHSIDEIRRLSALECDYVGFGPVFESTTKQTGYHPHGLEGLRRACLASSRPVVAIGGIGVDVIGAVREAGASGVAMISGLLASKDVGGIASRAVGEFFGR